MDYMTSILSYRGYCKKYDSTMKGGAKIGIPILYSFVVLQVLRKVMTKSWATINHFFFCGATAQSGSGTPNFLGLCITNN
jgi:hypothetical protein